MSIHAKVYPSVVVAFALLSPATNAQKSGGSISAPADTSQELNGSGQGATGTVSPGVRTNPCGANAKAAQPGSAGNKMPRAASEGHGDTTKKTY